MSDQDYAETEFLDQFYGENAPDDWEEAFDSVCCIEGCFESSCDEYCDHCGGALCLRHAEGLAGFCHECLKLPDLKQRVDEMCLGLVEQES